MVAMRLLARGLPVLLLALAGPAGGQEGTGRITGTVRLADDVTFESDTIVYVVGYSEPAPDRVAEVHQRDLKFVPPLLAITAGQEVSFPNDEDEKMLHHVYSRSPNRVDLGTFPPGETRKTKLAKPGVVQFYCELHPMMVAEVLVLPNRRFDLTASDGSYEIDGVRPGTWKVYAYHRGMKKPVQQEVEVVAGETAQRDFALGLWNE